jgi:hypothetical protein
MGHYRYYADRAPDRVESDAHRAESQEGGGGGLKVKLKFNSIGDSAGAATGAGGTGAGAAVATAGAAVATAGAASAARADDPASSSPSHKSKRHRVDEEGAQSPSSPEAFRAARPVSAGAFVCTLTWRLT